MKKIFEDTLKSNGKWSRKSLTILITIIFSFSLGTFIVISDYVLNKEVNRYAIEVFTTMMLFLYALMGLTEASKKFTNKQVPLNEE